MYSAAQSHTSIGHIPQTNRIADIKYLFQGTDGSTPLAIRLSLKLVDLSDLYAVASFIYCRLQGIQDFVFLSTLYRVGYLSNSLKSWIGLR